MSQERLMTVLLGPHVSEKGTVLAEKPEWREWPLGPNALRRRVIRDQVGVLFFQRLQAPHHAVVFGVGYFRVIERVITIVVITNLLAERRDLFLFGGARGHSAKKLLCWYWMTSSRM